MTRNMQQPWWSIYLLGIFMLGLDSKLVGKYNLLKNTKNKIQKEYKTRGF